uniref:Uncharacterized protein n=1 Tax=Accipiter nisus TaxID=211598 RepID=A0A8B9MCX3_9AVES
MSVLCVLLGKNEVAWQETRGIMHVNIGQEASRVGVGVAPAGMVVGATSWPSSSGNTPLAMPATADDATAGYFFQRQAGEQFSGYSSKHSWPTGDSIYIDHSAEIIWI